MYVEIVNLFSFPSSSTKEDEINNRTRDLERRDFDVFDVAVVSDGRGEIVSAVIKYGFGE